MQAANAQFAAAEASRLDVLVSVTAEVARNYFDMRNFERQIVLTQQNLATQQRTLQLIQAQLRGGLASDFDVQRAGAQVSTTEALIPVLQASHDAALNGLNILDRQEGAGEKVVGQEIPGMGTEVSS